MRVVIKNILYEQYCLNSDHPIVFMNSMCELACYSRQTCSKSNCTHMFSTAI